MDVFIGWATKLKSPSLKERKPKKWEEPSKKHPKK